MEMVAMTKEQILGIWLWLGVLPSALYFAFDAFRTRRVLTRQLNKGFWDLKRDDVPTSVRTRGRLIASFAFLIAVGFLAFEHWPA